MGASFRNTGQILALAGCDLLTISPELLAELQKSDDPVPRRLIPPSPAAGESFADAAPPSSVSLGVNAFRWALNEDAMATEKLAEGIRSFAADSVKLDQLISALQDK